MPQNEEYDHSYNLSMGGGGEANDDGSISINFEGGRPKEKFANDLMETKFGFDKMSDYTERVGG